MIKDAPDCLAGGGEAGALLRAIDWASSPLGPPGRWPDELKTVVRAVLASDAPMLVHWGPEQVCFYNDASSVDMGERHPQALGRPARAWIAELRDAHERLQRTLANTEIIGLWDWRIPENRVVADRRFAELYGVDPARAAVGVPIEDFMSGVHPRDRDALTGAIERALASGQPFAAEYSLLDRNGTMRQVVARGQATYDAAGVAVRFAGATVDVTHQREAETARQESDQRYAVLFNAIDAGFCIIDMIYDAAGKAVDYRYIEVNAAFERQSGIVGPAGRRIREFAPDLEDHWFEMFGRVAETGVSARLEDHAKDLERWFDVYATKIGGAGSRRVALLFTDITDTKTAELKLRASEEQFRLFAQAMPNHVWTSPPDGMLDWFNHRVFVYSGMTADELAGAGWTAMVHPDDLAGAADKWAAARAAGVVYETEFRLQRADGVYRWHIARAVPILAGGVVERWIGTNTDIEEQKAAAAALADLNATLEARVETRTKALMATEEQLRQAQKMEAIGQLTGGIAHDFNNLMTGITSALSLIRRRIDKGQLADLPVFMDAAASSAHRAAALTHRLLAFSRRQPLDARATDVAALVDGMRALLNQTLGENIRFTFEPAAGLWLAMTDAHQLENAVLNLAINARDAMPEGGSLIIGAENVTGWRGKDEGEYVVVSVTDTGTGMPADVIKQAFDPFFTTKPIGKGTGLGLSMIYGFAQQSGGHVHIDSTVGRGTTVLLYLPRAMAEAAHEPERATGAAPQGAGETILVVEDDPTVRLLVTAALTEWGYRCIEADSATAAMPLLEAPGRIDMLLTDIGLPRINGRELVVIARQIRPELKVLFMSGYEDAAAERDPLAAAELLTKPFSLEALGAKVRDVIAG